MVVCNDSCYGPVFKFEDVFKHKKIERCDFWGMVNSTEGIHHIQSFFYVFKKRVLNDWRFSRFVYGFKKQDGFWDYVNKYERVWTRYLEENGYKSGAYIDFRDNPDYDYILKISGIGNSTLFPNTMLEKGMPLIKVKCFNDGFGADLSENPIILLKKLNLVNPVLSEIIKRDIMERKFKFGDRWIDFEKSIDDAVIVSFDIFDILLIRPYLKPVDLFKHIEEKENVVGFYKERIEAERRARAKNPDKSEITIDIIYNEIDEKYKWIKELELMHEKKVLVASPVMKKIYDYAVKQNKRIIAVSDMYLPSSFLKEVLGKNGYNKIEKIYVSSEYNACKHDSGLFKHVIENEKIKPEYILHIGDNPISDKLSPEKLEIKTIYCESITSQFLNKPSNLKFLNISKEKSLLSSVLLSLFVINRYKNDEKSMFYELGFFLGGAFAVGYTQFIHKICQSNDVDFIIYVSRDGYILQKVYKILFGNDIKNEYVYASRRLILKSSHNRIKQDYYKKLFINNYCIFKNDFSIKNYDDLYDKHFLDYKEYVDKNLESYKKYLENKDIRGKRIVSVDTTTGQFTSSNFFKEIFRENFAFGIFSGSFNESDNLYFAYSDRLFTKEDTPIVNILEELITAPEYNVIDFKDGNPLFEYPTPIEKNRIKIYKDIAEGILDFAFLYKEIFSGYDIDISFRDLMFVYRDYLFNLNYGDQVLLDKILHSYDSENIKYSSLLDSVKKIKKDVYWHNL